MTKARLDVVPLTEHIGAAIRGLDLHDKPDDETIKESGPLLNAVFDHAEKKEFVYEHVWRIGDLLLWDNRCSSHARTDFPSTQSRLMWRTTVKGARRPY